MKTGFQFAEAQLMTVRKEVSSLSHTVEKVSEQVHNNALAILDQREELMIKDQLNQVQFYLLQLDGSLLRARDEKKRTQIQGKIDEAEKMRDDLIEKSNNMASAIRKLVEASPDGLHQAPATPPRLTPRVLPPPPPPTPAQSDMAQLPMPSPTKHQIP